MEGVPRAVDFSRMGRELWEGSQGIYRTISRSQRLVAAVLAVGTVALLARFVNGLVPYVVNCQYWDEWAVPTFPFGKWATLSWWDLFHWQHNATRLGLGIPLSKLAYSLTRYNQASIVWLQIILNALALACALFVRRRLWGAWSYADLTIPILFTALTQWETYLVTGNECCHVLPLLLLMLYCAAWLIKRPGLRYSAVVVMNVLMGWSGFGIFVLLQTPLLLAVSLWHARKDRQERWQAAAALLGSLASIAVYLHGYRWQSDDRSGIRLFDYLTFMAAEVAHPFGLENFEIYRTYYVGGTILLLMVAACAWSAMRWARTQRQEYLVVCILTGFSLLFVASTAWGRTPVPVASDTGSKYLLTAWGQQPGGIILARNSRYTVQLMPGLLGLYLLPFTWPSRWRRLALLGCLLAAGLAIYPLKDSDIQSRHYYQSHRRRWLQVYRQTHDVFETNRIVKFKLYPNELKTNLPGKLDYFEKHRLGPFADG